MEHTCALIRQAKEGDMEARSRLVEENVGLIWSVVRRFQGRVTTVKICFRSEVSGC